MVGRVIGKGGETVKGLQRQFQATIQIDQNATPCKVRGGGREERALTLKRVHLVCMASASQNLRPQVFVRLSFSTMQHLISARTATETSSTILFCHLQITITGAPEAVAGAERAVRELVEDRPPPMGAGGFGGEPTGRGKVMI